MVLNGCRFDNTTVAVLTTYGCRIVNRVLSYLKVYSLESVFNNGIWHQTSTVGGDSLQSHERSKTASTKTTRERISTRSRTFELVGGSAVCRKKSDRSRFAALVPQGLLAWFRGTHRLPTPVRAVRTLESDVQPGPESVGNGAPGESRPEAGEEAANRNRRPEVSGACPRCGCQEFEVLDPRLADVVNCCRCHADLDVLADGVRLNSTRPRQCRQDMPRLPPWVQRPAPETLHQ